MKILTALGIVGVQVIALLFLNPTASDPTGLSIDHWGMDWTMFDGYSISERQGVPTVYKWYVHKRIWFFDINGKFHPKRGDCGTGYPTGLSTNGIARLKRKL